MLFLIFLTILHVNACITNTPQPLEVNWPPILNSTSLTDNVLYLSIHIPIVLDRYNYTITLSNCNSCDNWVVSYKNCQMIFNTNISLVDLNIESDNYIGLISFTYNEKVISEFQNFTRFIDNVLEFELYFPSLINVTTNLVYINSYSDLQHTAITDTFTEGQISYITINSFLPFTFIQISIQNKYLLLNGNITSFGEYNNLQIYNNSFQFQVSIGNSEMDLVNNTGTYNIQILLLSGSRTDNIITGNYDITIINNNNKNNNNQQTTNKISSNSALIYISVVSVLTLIPISMFIFNKYRTKTNINPLTV
jgi:hypothetical protein